jgi:hypothetical protein
VHKVGRSIVIHYDGCTEVLDPARWDDVHPDVEDPADIEASFHTCIPDDYDLDHVLVEQDRPWVLTTEDPHTVIEELHIRKNRGRILSRSASNLLKDASVKDETLAAAYAVQRIA